MTIRSRISQVLQQEDLNFLLTNPAPRRLLTRFMGSFSQIEQPLIRAASIAVWRFFCARRSTPPSAACMIASSASSRTARGRSRPIPPSW
jgi:hypothetical protein